VNNLVNEDGVGSRKLEGRVLAVIQPLVPSINTTKKVCWGLAIFSSASLSADGPFTFPARLLFPDSTDDTLRIVESSNNSSTASIPSAASSANSQQTKQISTIINYREGKSLSSSVFDTMSWPPRALSRTLAR
jgi:hypothetical protein